MSKHLVSFKPELNNVLFTLYLGFITFVYLFVYVTTEPLKLILMTAGLLVLYYVITVFLFALLGRIALYSPAEIRTRNLIITFAVSAAVCFALLMLWYLTYYPGCFGADSL